MVETMHGDDAADQLSEKHKVRTMFMDTQESTLIKSRGMMCVGVINK